MNQLRFVHALFQTSIRESLSLRSEFLLQLCFMAVNNVMVFVTWWILFDRFDNIRGYRLPDMLCMFGVGAAGFGLAAVLFGGSYELSRKIVDGELNAAALTAQERAFACARLPQHGLGMGRHREPAGLVVYLPVELLRQFTLQTLLLAVGGVALHVLVSTTVFYRGRQRYESGSRMGVWG